MVDGGTKTGEARILVVDDDAGLRDLASRALSRQGYEVEVSPDGKDALALVGRHVPSLMLVDYRLPDMTGRDLMVSLNERGVAVPFVMMTGQGDERLAVEIMKLGAADYLIKDTDLIERLPAAVERILKSVALKRRLTLAEESLRLAANVFTHSREGILITDSNADIIDVNPAFSDITGYGREEALGKNPRILNSGRQTGDFYSGMWETLLSRGHWNGELWNRRKDGGIYAQLLNISSVRDERGEIRNFIAQFSDITTLKEYQSQLEKIAHYDALTGLPNRLLLQDRIVQAMAQAPRRGMHMAIAYLDLDGFKAVNDTHGHETGDKLLAKLAGRMQLSLRDGDTLSRLGGDEFVAVLVDLPDMSAAGPVIARLLEAVNQPVLVDSVELRVSASLGVSLYPQTDEVDAEQLLRQADQAMYQAKQSGKNRFHVFDAEYDRNVRGRYENLKQIERALERREFTLFYQPKVNMRTGALIGAEALIRWMHPKKGLLPPSEFLPVVENHPLSIRLGEWVIETALAQIEAWHAEGLDVPVSVNVSAFQLQNAAFAAGLRETLERHPGVRPGDLELEILETSALDDISSMSELIALCEELGVGFALDDFGTGYSSLQYLKRLPAGLIKIDQSFVRDLLDNPEDLAILEGVVGLASAFRRNLIAEGVETIDHGEILLCMGCEWAQGYAIARPMPASDFRDWIGTWDAPAIWKNQDSIGRESLSSVYAAVEHRSWVLSLRRYLEGQRDAPPITERKRCRFCAWLERGGHRALPEKDRRELELLHERAHLLAETLIDRKGADRADFPRDALLEAARLGDAVFRLLGPLYRCKPDADGKKTGSRQNVHSGEKS